MTPEEEWRPVVGYEGRYEVSDLGRVRSLDRRVSRGDHTVLVRGRILAPHSNPYPMVALHADGVQTSHRIHVLVAAAFIGPRPPGMYVCHDNGDEQDNRLTNLRYDTPSANEYDSIRHGRHAATNKTHCPRGHAYSPENTYVMKAGGRRCTECHRLRSIEYRRRARMEGKS